MNDNFIQSVCRALNTDQLVDLGLPDNTSWGEIWAMQQAITSGITRPKIGYKLGVHAQHGAIWAPIFAHTTYPPMGIMGYECEIAVKLGGALVAGATTMPAGSELLVGVEILSSPLTQKSKDFKAFMASGMGQYSYFAGKPIPYRDGLVRADNIIRLLENGTEILHDRHSHPDGNPLDVLWKFLANPPSNFTAFASGDIITLGSIMGLKPIQNGMVLDVHINDIGHLQVNL